MSNYSVKKKNLQRSAGDNAAWGAGSQQNTGFGNKQTFRVKRFYRVQAEPSSRCARWKRLGFCGHVVGTSSLARGSRQAEGPNWEKIKGGAIFCVHPSYIFTL